MLFRRGYSAHLSKLTASATTGRLFSGQLQKLFDPDKQYLKTSAAEKKYVALNGLEESTPCVTKYDNPAKHISDLPIWSVHHSADFYMGSLRYYQEPRTHSEPIGYIVGSDPHDHRGYLDYPILLVFFGFFMFLYFNTFFFKFDNKRKQEVLYHTRLTANQIEDEIRELREERSAVVSELEEINKELAKLE